MMHSACTRVSAPHRLCLTDGARTVHHSGMESDNPIDRAAAAVGGPERFRELLGIGRRAFFYWRAGRIPAERVPEISRVTGIPRHVLCPKLWEAPASSEAA